MSGLKAFFKLVCLLSIALIGSDLLSSSVLLAVEPALRLQYFQALRDRGLFTVAEEYAGSHLALPGISPDDRIDLTLELATTLLEHGIVATESQRAELWSAAERTVAGLDSLDLPPLQAMKRDAWLNQARSQQACTLAFESQLLPDDRFIRQQALTRLQASVTALQAKLVPDPDEERRSSSPRRPLPAEISLREHLRQQTIAALIDCLLWQAEITPSGPDRAASLLEADRLTEQALRVNPREEINARSGLQRLRLFRLQRDERQAMALISRLTDQAGPVFRDALLAEQLRLLLSLQQARQAADIIAQRLNQNKTLSDELRAVCVQVWLACARQAARQSDPTQAQKFETAAESQIPHIGGRWRQMAVLQLEHARLDQKYGPQVAALKRQAASAWRHRHPTEAADLFLQGAQQAADQQHPRDSFELQLAGASILIQSEQWPQAIAALEQALRIAPDLQQAAQADLLRCFALGRQNKNSSVYEQALRDHLARFAAEPTRWDAVRMLAALKEQAGHPAEALDLYRQIPAEHPLRTIADERIIALLTPKLPAGGRSDSGPTPSSPPAALSLEPALSPEQNAELKQIVERHARSPESLTPEQARILLSAGRVLLNSDQQPLDRIVEALRRAVQAHARQLQQNQTLPPEWNSIAQETLQLKILFLAHRQQWDEARALLTQLEQADAGMLLAVLSGMNVQLETMNPQERHELGHLARQAVQNLQTRRSQLTPEQTQLLDQAAAQASLAIEDWPAALQGFEALHARSPRNPEYLRQIIAASLGQGLPADLQRATDTARQLERLYKAGSPDWIEARLLLAEIDLRAGKPSDARKLLEITTTLYPQLGTPALQERAARLQSRLEQQPARQAP